jgi:hypothetical protein
MRAAVAIGRAVRTPALPRSCSEKRLATEAVVLCLWVAVGLALTGAFFAAGFGPELTQALGAAG